MKRPKSRNLDEHEWAFHRVPEKQWYACLWHEKRRELGVPEPPWLALEETKREELTAGCCPGDLSSIGDVEYTAYLRENLKSMDPQAFEDLLKSGKLATPPGQEVVRIAIDWSASDKKIKRDFARWLESERNHPPHLAWQFKGSKGKRGRRIKVKERLVELAVYRAARAGYGPKEIQHEFKPLLQGLQSFRELDSRRVLRMRQHVKKWVKSTVF